MTQEDKQLLLKDLWGRLPYGVIVRHADYLLDSDGNYTGQFWYKRGYLYNICRDNMTTTIIESKGSDEEGYKHICDLERSLPYLRSMSSMTKEERRIFTTLMAHALPFTTVEWLDKNHFDHRTNEDGDHLIDIGLALEAPDDMYKKEKQQ